MKGDVSIHERQDEYLIENSNREIVNSVLRCEEDAYA
jgi:ribosome maturation protein Sdo1